MYLIGGVVDRVLKPLDINHHKGAHCSLCPFPTLIGKVIKGAGLDDHGLGKIMIGDGNFYDFKLINGPYRYDHK